QGRLQGIQPRPGAGRRPPQRHAGARRRRHGTPAGRSPENMSEANAGGVGGRPPSGDSVMSGANAGGAGGRPPSGDSVMSGANAGGRPSSSKGLNLLLDEIARATARLADAGVAPPRRAADETGAARGVVPRRVTRSWAERMRGVGPPPLKG